MTTTQNYNPLRNALVELTSAQAFRWYLTQAKATAALAQTIAFRSFTTAQRLLSDRNSIAIAPAIAKPENAEFLCEAIAPTIAPAVKGDSVAVEGLENAIAPQQEYAQAEATEAQEEPVPDGWEAIEADDTTQAQLDQAEAEWKAIAPTQDMAIAQAIEPEPELDDSEGDRFAIDEPEQAKAPHEDCAPPQEYAKAEAIAPEPDFGESINVFTWVDDARLEDEDDAEDEAGDEA